MYRIKEFLRNFRVYIIIAVLFAVLLRYVWY